MKNYLPAVILLIYLSYPSSIFAKPDNKEPNTSASFDISTGLIGIYAPVNLAIVLPKFNPRFSLGFRASWSMPAIVIPHYNADKTELLGYLPMLTYGSFFIQGGSGLLKNLLITYGGLEVLLGVTLATDKGLIGKNITVGSIFYGGFEIFPKKRFGIYLEGGISAIFTLVYAEHGDLDTNQHGGTGFFIRFGSRIYFG